MAEAVATAPHVDASTIARPSLAVMLSGYHRIAGPDVRAYIEGVRDIEQRGFDEFLLADHVVLGGDLESYPYGEFAWGSPVQPHEPWPDTLSMMAAIAVATERIGIGTGVLIAPLRPAILLANQLATIDQISNGRVSVGVGVGWLQMEFDALGVPFAERWSRTADTMRACRALWTQLPASFESPSVSFSGVYCSPQPVGRIPIWLGTGMSRERAAWLAEVGDGWFPMNPDPALVADGLRLLRDELERRGRDVGEIGVRVGAQAVTTRSGGIDVGATIDAVRPALEVGVTSLWFPVTPHLGLETVSETRHYLDELAALCAADWN
jgi:probable F420-dependent oxidoreductase